MCEHHPYHTRDNDTVRIRGARVYNLKNVDLDTPCHKLVMVTGLSSSGKPSLAFDTLYAEGQRRYAEGLSAYVRQLLQMMDKPDVDLVEGLPPAISIEQKSTSHNPRSTVDVATEIRDYPRLLYARVGTPHCLGHNLPLPNQIALQMVDVVLKLPEDMRVIILTPAAREHKGEFADFFVDLQTQGSVWVCMDGEVYQLDEVSKLGKKHQA